jgi:hypothetical protein
MSRDFTEHFSLVVFAQDKWNEKDRKRIGTNVKARFLELAGHSDCKTCGSCPICRSFEELFDPAAPGPYDQPCGLCKGLHTKMKSLLGKNDGFVLFSHTRPIGKDLVTLILKDKHVKKVFVLSWITSKVHKPSVKDIEGLSIDKIVQTDFLKGTPKDNIIYEVHKDEYV